MKELTKEELYDLYEKQLKTTREIAKICECSPHTIVRRLRSFGISVRPTGNYKEKEYHFESPIKQTINDDNKLISLFNNYTPLREIAKELDVCTKAVIRRIKELGLKRDKNKMMSRDLYKSDKDEKIVELYKKGKSTTEIGNMLGVSHSFVLTHLKHCGIDRRTLSESQFAYNKKEKPNELDSYELMYDLYINNKMTKNDIGRLLYIDPSTVDATLRKLGIPIRGNSEAKKGLFTGKDAGNYKDGRTPLYARLREYFKKWQARDVIKRDGYCCQMCGSKKHLHVHHIIPFKQIFEDILSEHPNLNPIDNADELYEIATHDERMNSLDNLITYCKECHLFKVHGYKRNNKIKEA